MDVPQGIESVVFRASVGNGPGGDIAIDDVIVRGDRGISSGPRPEPGAMTERYVLFMNLKLI